MKPDSPLLKVVDWIVAVGLFLIGTRVFPLGGSVHAPTDAEFHALRMAVALLSVILGVAWILLRKVRLELVRINELLVDVLYGAGTKRDRDAVDILVGALRTPEYHVQEAARRSLKTITGMDLGEDPASWERWWASARDTFVRARASGPEKK